MINTVKGLTKEEAQKRLREYGPNSLPVPRHRFLKLILRQFKGIFNLLLIAAAVVTYLLGEPIDAAFILFSCSWELHSMYIRSINQMQQLIS